MLRDCSPTCMTQPVITSSTWAGSSSLRACSALSGSEARSTACQLRSLPLRFPPAVRTASTITAVVMESPSGGPADSPAPSAVMLLGPLEILQATGSVRPDDRHLGGRPDRPQHGPLAGRRRHAASSARSAGRSSPTGSTARTSAGSRDRSSPTELACNPAGSSRPGSTRCCSTPASTSPSTPRCRGATGPGPPSSSRPRRCARPRRATTYRLRGQVVRMARQVAYGEATVRDPDGELFTRATGTFLLHRAPAEGAAS